MLGASTSGQRKRTAEARFRCFPSWLLTYKGQRRVSCSPERQGPINGGSTRYRARAGTPSLSRMFPVKCFSVCACGWQSAFGHGWKSLVRRNRSNLVVPREDVNTTNFAITGYVRVRNTSPTRPRLCGPPSSRPPPPRRTHLHSSSSPLRPYPSPLRPYPPKALQRTTYSPLACRPHPPSPSAPSVRPPPRRRRLAAVPSAGGCQLLVPHPLQLLQLLSPPPSPAAGQPPHSPAVVPTTSTQLLSPGRGHWVP